MFTTKFSTKLITAVTILLLALSSVQPALAQAASSTSKSSDTFLFSFFNDCTGEVVSAVVSGNSTIHKIIDADRGIIHLRLHDVYIARAVGETSGIQYVGTQIDQGGFQVAGTGVDGLAYTFTLSFRFISRGSTDNILTHILLHTTITPNGETIIDNIDYSYVCGG
jgi:hypothetical protein